VPIHACLDDTGRADILCAFDRCDQEQLRIGLQAGRKDNVDAGVIAHD
jgi:hypothetical protein